MERGETSKMLFNLYLALDLASKSFHDMDLSSILKQI